MVALGDRILRVKPGRVTIEKGDVSVAPGLMTGTFTVMGPTLGVDGSGGPQPRTRNVVRGAWTCR